MISSISHSNQPNPLQPNQQKAQQNKPAAQQKQPKQDTVSLSNVSKTYGDVDQSGGGH